jgi:flagellar basal body-associated protein FliL
MKYSGEMSVASKRKRSKEMMIMLLPLLIFVFIVGWCMYWVGDQKRTGKTQRKPSKKDNVTIMPIILEETQEIANE